MTIDTQTATPELTTEAAVTPEPQSLEQQIADDLGVSLDDDGLDDLSTTAATDTPPAQLPDPQTTDDFDAIPDRDPSGRQTRIPKSKAKEFVEKARTKAEAEWQQSIRESLGLPDDAPITHADTRQHLQNLRAYEQEVASMRQVERLMVEAPEQFLQHLAHINPAYGTFLNAPRQHASQPEGRPEPDVDLGNGQRTYSVDGLSRLMEWQRQQAVAEAEARIAQRLAPFEQQAQAQAAYQAAIPRIQQMVTDARTWPGFTDHEGDILKALQSDQRLTLDAAYRKVVLPKLTTDRNKVREEVLAEIRTKPASTAIPSSVGTSHSEPETLEGRIMADLRRAGHLK